MIYNAFMDTTSSTSLTREVIYEVASNKFPPQGSMYVWNGNILTEESYSTDDTFIQLLDDMFATYLNAGLDFEWLETKYQLYKKFCSRQIPSLLVSIELCKHQLGDNWLYMYRLTD